MTRTIAPVRRQIVVAAPPDVAFETFTSETGKWWPLGRGHSVYGQSGMVRFSDGRLIEESPDGVAVWGSVLDWDPPSHLRISWHPGRSDEVVSEVSVRFAAIGSQTLVTLEHSGWERFPDPLGYRDEYAGSWIAVMGEYAARFTNASDLPAEDAWLVLARSPGVNAPPDGNVLADPGFMEHMRFVSELTSRGVVVGAGPIAGRTGHGMTILRVREASVAEYVRQAYRTIRASREGSCRSTYDRGMCG